MLTVHLQGGLGNQLFQLGFLDFLKYKTNKQIYLSHLKSPSTVHSSEEYFETIFKEWKSIYVTENIDNINIYEHSEMNIDLSINTNICYFGYFQNYEYLEKIKDSFIKKLQFNEEILNKYPQIHKKIFIHIRGGDFIEKPYHNLCTKEYYEKAINLFNEGEFIIFTNDISYSKKLFPDIPIIEESEIDSLFLMSKCLGCICANSSFSWWGSYLNSDRKIIIPSKWVNGNYHHETYRVPGWTVIVI